MKDICLIVAKNVDNGIGYNGDLLFRLKSDMEFFKKITLFTPDSDLINCVIMGHNTWNSIPDKFKPLPNRLNVILSTNNFHILKKIYENNNNIIISDNFNNNIEQLKKRNDIYNIFIIGGNLIYKKSLNIVNKLYITNILYKLPIDKIDTFLCDIDFSKFQLVNETSISIENGKILPINKYDNISFYISEYSSIIND